MSFATDFPERTHETGVGVARMIDISAVQAQHGHADIDELATRAKEFHYIAAHVLPSWVPTLAPLLAGSDTRVGSPVGFPSGGTSTAVKAFEANWLIEAGVQEMDIVINVGLIRSGEDAAAAAEIRTVLDVVAGRVPTKVILEVGHLEGDQLEHAAQAALDGGAISLKTGTGWSGVATTVDHVSRIRAVAGPDVEIKASGGVRSLADLAALYDAGARRFGANIRSAGLIVGEASGQSSAVNGDGGRA